MEIIVGRQGNQKIKINDSTVSRKHVRITSLPDGTYKIEDLGSAGGTYVDGMRIRQKIVSGDTVVQLGPNVKYKVKDLMPVPTPPPGPTPPGPTPQPEYSIDHLKDVWEEYERQLAAIQEERQEMGKKRMLPMMLSMASGALAPILATIIGTETLYITLPITAVCLMLYIIAYNQKDTGFEKQKEAKNRLIQKYVCPNPNCRKFVGMQDFVIMSQMPACPKCKARWVVRRY